MERKKSYQRNIYNILLAGHVWTPFLFASKNNMKIYHRTSKWAVVEGCQRANLRLKIDCGSLTVISNWNFQILKVPPLRKVFLLWFSFKAESWRHDLSFWVKKVARYACNTRSYPSLSYLSKFSVFPSS
jgi:hypothetical protein